MTAEVVLKDLLLENLNHIHKKEEQFQQPLGSTVGPDSMGDTFNS
jgi:hypothetical protein